MPAGRRRCINRFISTWPSAERFEALVRAFNDPAPYVKRLARLLKRKATLAHAFLIERQREYGITPLEPEIETATQIAERRAPMAQQRYELAARST